MGPDAPPFTKLRTATRGPVASIAKSRTGPIGASALSLAATVTVSRPVLSPDNLLLGAKLAR